MDIFASGYSGIGVLLQPCTSKLRHFHSGNRGSNPRGDAKNKNATLAVAFLFCLYAIRIETLGLSNYRPGRPRGVSKF
jgi:hypothetical protein